jgi:hypothetical protein
VVKPGDGSHVCEKSIVVPPEVAVELRSALGVDLRGTVEGLRIAAEDAERALEAQDTASLASRVHRFREITDAIDARRQLHVVVGFSSQPVTTCTINGDAECSLCVELLVAHRKTLVEHLTDGYDQDRDSVIETVRRLTSFLSDIGIDPTRLADAFERRDGS